MTAVLTAAERILQSLGVTDPQEIDLEAIAWTQGVVVNYRPLDGCEARIIGSSRKAVISINSRSPERRRRFSLAHELGHWHHHRGRVLFCGKDDIGNFANDALESRTARRHVRLGSNPAELPSHPTDTDAEESDLGGRA